MHAKAPDLPSQRLRGYIRLALFVAFFFALIPYGVMSRLRHRLRLRLHVSRSKCPNCEALLGSAAMATSRPFKHDGLRDVEGSEDDHAYVTGAKQVEVLCPGCGICLRFDDSEKAFKTIVLRQSGKRA